MAHRPDEQLKIDAIDSMLGDEEEDSKEAMRRALGTPDLGAGEPSSQFRDLSSMGPMTPIPSTPAGPAGPRDPIGAPDAFTREPSGAMESPTLVGARDGATTMGTPTAPTPTPVTSLEPPTGALAPQPTTPPVTPPAPAPSPGTGVSPRASSGDLASGASNAQEAYNNFAGSIDPNAPQGEMEAAIERHFGNVPGYQQAYKESVKINGKWYDLVGGYGGPNASFHGLMEKKGGKGAGFLGGGEDGGFGMGEIDDASRLEAILASLDATSRGEGSPLVKQSIDELLGGGSVTPNVVQPIAQPRGASRRRQSPITEAPAFEGV